VDADEVHEPPDAARCHEFGEGGSQQGFAVLSRAFEVQAMLVTSDRCEVDAFINEAIAGETLDGYEEWIEREGGAGGVGRVAWSNRPRGQHLPGRTPGAGEEIDVAASFAAEAARARQRTRMEQDARDSFSHRIEYQVKVQ
jgi:hypothetical protein